MGARTDKLFLPVAGPAPRGAHVGSAFDSAAAIAEIILVVRDSAKPRGVFQNWRSDMVFASPSAWFSGGKERQDSVWNGLEKLAAGTEIVAIQDAARPCTTEALIEATIAAARQEGAARGGAASHPDTIKESEDGLSIARHLDRSRLHGPCKPRRPFAWTSSVAP